MEKIIYKNANVHKVEVKELVAFFNSIKKKREAQKNVAGFFFAYFDKYGKGDEELRLLEAIDVYLDASSVLIRGVEEEGNARAAFSLLSLAAYAKDNARCGIIEALEKVVGRSFSAEEIFYLINALDSFL